ncbi:BglG family transcription antiterminator [Paenibacillus sp. GCM10028914]|uniref:BglG family transcription antiterminator n=1 Tax=Paenibacillus sp. GCM10028914 TaxID=3273416 RepID=UPI0036086F51
MRQITARKRQILLLLMDRKEGMTAAEIASEVGVSVRTVHREMEEIEAIVKAYGLVLHKKSGIGIRIEGHSEEDLEEFRTRLLSDQSVDFSGEERKILILCTLLDSDEPVKLFALAHSLKVTVSTISNDLDELEFWTNRFGLKLIRRRGYGVEIEGEESGKREGICQLVFDNLDYSDLVGNKYTYTNKPVAVRLLSMIGKSLFLDVENTLWDMDWSWTNDLSESAYTEMIITLSVSVSRIRQGRTVTFKYGSTDFIKEDGAFAGIKQFTDHLGKSLGIQFSTDEVRYVAQLFNRVQETSAISELAHADVEMIEMVYRLIESVVSRTGIPFLEDRSLRQGLVEHIGAAIKRIREGMRIRNPLLSAIRKDYEDLFQIIKESVKELIRGLDVPDEEIGFLVMHFGASMERLSQLGRNVRAILVCSNGLSSSKLLGTRLSKEMPQIKVLGNISWYEAARIPEGNYDLIISTIDLPLAADKYIKISPLLTQEDTDKLLQFIQNTTLKKRGTGSDSDYGSQKNLADEVRKETSLVRLRAQAALMNEIVSLLDGFHLYALDNKQGDLNETLNQALAMIRRQGKITDAWAIRKRLLERERMGSQLIPDTSLALFHTRSRFVSWPSLTLFRLSNPVSLEDGAEARVLLFMLAPKELPRESLEVLSEISALMLKEELIDLLEQGKQEDIQVYLAEELQHFFNIKI